MIPRMILHDYFRSSAAYRVRIALNLKGLAAERRFVHLRRGDQRTPAYLEINPQGLVPTLEIGERRLTQSLAIIEYLDEKHPLPPTGMEDTVFLALKALRRELADSRKVPAYVVFSDATLLAMAARKPSAVARRRARRWSCAKAARARLTARTRGLSRFGFSRAPR